MLLVTKLFLLFVTTMLILKVFAVTIVNVVTCPYRCLSYFDGCNLCDCTDSNNPICTKRNCRILFGTPSCIKCESNFEYNDCAASCDKTCADPSPLCIAQCYQRCECPADKPILNNGVCITYDDCGQTQIQDICPDDCSVYFDGCNYCDCNPDGSMTCTTNVCSTYSDAYCSTCKNNLEWTSCGSSCTKTCTDTDPPCDTVCTERCQCPSDKPYYYNGACLAIDECFNFQKVCPANCTTYYDGCNDCTCFSGDDACTNHTCIENGTAQCTNCTSNMEWTTCGSPCIKTCADPNPSCKTSCTATCACPPSKPLFKNDTCIASSECDCKCTGIPLPNGIYAASRTKKCSAASTKETCKQLRACIWKCQ